MTDMTMQPSNTNPGHAYKWYQGVPVYKFGHGLHFTTFSVNWTHAPPTQYGTTQLVPAAPQGSPLDLTPFDVFNITVQNIGEVTSDYVALLFLNGPAPHPNKQLIACSRLHQIEAGGIRSAKLSVTIVSLARADANKWQSLNSQ